MSKTEWDEEFGCSYTPREMLDMGIFEGTYIRAIKKTKWIPDEILKHPKYLKKGEPPDVNINYYGVKSRLSLKEWQKRGWIMSDVNGWFEWFCNYFYGRRLGEEDRTQIKRWKSFVARHSAQVVKNCKKGDKNCRPAQRQGLLQWAWNSDTPFSPEQIKKNVERIKKLSK